MKGEISDKDGCVWVKFFTLMPYNILSG